MSESWPMGYKFYSRDRTAAEKRAVQLGLTAVDVVEVQVLRVHKLTAAPEQQETMMSKLAIKVDVKKAVEPDPASLVADTATDRVCQDDDDDDPGLADDEVLEADSILYKVEVKP